MGNDDGYRKSHLIKSKYRNAIIADQTFNILMGSEIEPRREFIEQNARYVQNLDV